jgi:hypothetical protein
MASEGGLGIPLMLLNALDTYNGTTEPEEWLRTFEKVAITAQWTPSKRLRMAHLFLKGEADNIGSKLNPTQIHGHGTTS